MPRMLDLIRASAVPATLVQSAARGALSIPPDETLEILVYLAKHNQIFGAQARMTLAGWDEKSALLAAENPKTSQEVLDYLIAPENLRPKLLPALLENPTVRDESLMELAVTGSREVVEAMIGSSRVNRTPSIRNALSSNPNVTGIDSAKLDQQASQPDGNAALTTAEIGESHIEQIPGFDVEPAGTAEPQEVLDEEIITYFQEHADEIAAEEGKPFQAIGGVFDELESTPATSATAGTEPKSSAPATSTHSIAALVSQKREEAEAKRGSALQKISKLDVKGRIQLAMKGTKEERSILIRDGTKIVALAVLDSPKISDGEVEAFASQKNVLEAVLRGIPMKRRFAKHYPVIRNLVFNPRTPMDLSLSLMKHILVNDLRHLSANKEVSDTVRKLALKMFKQKSDTTKKHTD
jgi:hypothetical protein